MANGTIPANLFLSTTIYDRNSTTRLYTGETTTPGGDGYKLIRYASIAVLTVKIHSDIDLTDSKIQIEAYNGNIKNNGTVEYGALPQVNTATNTIEVVWMSPHDYDFTLRIKLQGIWFSTTIGTVMTNYIVPTCVIEKTSYDETNNKLKIKISGKYYNGSLGTANNSYKFQWRSRVINGNWSSWSTDNSNISGFTISNFNYSAVGTFTIQGKVVQDFQFRLIDKFNTIDSNILLVQGTPIFDWSNEDFHFGVTVNMDRPLNADGGIYSNSIHTNRIDLGASGDIIRNGQSIFSKASPFRATNNFSAAKAISDTNVIGETNNNISITAYSPTWTNSNLSGGGHNFTFYIIQPFNLVLLRGYVSGFSSDLASSTSYINLCQFDADFGAADTSALSVSGPKPCSAIINTDGYIKIIVPEGTSTETQLYITGIYPLNNNSSYYQS